jgi:hypothetical protein
MKSAWRWPAGLIVLGATIAVPVGSWSLARKHADLGTLRWCVVTKRPVVVGARIVAEDVGLTIRRVKADTCVADARRVTGKYASAHIGAGELVTATHLAEFVPARVPADGAGVPVEVKTEHAGSVKPGARLVFVQEKDKRAIMVPERKGKGPKPKWNGLEVISIAVSAKDASVTTLMVAVEPSDVALIPALAIGQWRPVIISNP